MATITFPGATAARVSAVPKSNKASGFWSRALLGIRTLHFNASVFMLPWVLIFVCHMLLCGNSSAEKDRAKPTVSSAKSSAVNDSFSRGDASSVAAREESARWWKGIFVDAVILSMVLWGAIGLLLWCANAQPRSGGS